MSEYNGQYAQALASLYNQLQNIGAGGNVNLANVPFTPNQNTPVTTYGATSGGMVGNFVPDNGNGNALTQEQLNSYAKSVLNGMPDTMNLQVGAIGKGVKVGEMPNGSPINNTIDTDKVYDLMNTYNALKNGGR